MSAQFMTSLMVSTLPRHGPWPPLRTETTGNWHYHRTPQPRSFLVILGPSLRHCNLVGRLGLSIIHLSNKYHQHILSRNRRMKCDVPWTWGSNGGALGSKIWRSGLGTVFKLRLIVPHHPMMSVACTVQVTRRFANFKGVFGSLGSHEFVFVWFMVSTDRCLGLYVALLSPPTSYFH